MAQNAESPKRSQKSPNSHLSCVNCPDTSISSFDLLTPYRSNKHNRAAVSAAAALFLQAATADSGNQRKSIHHSLLNKQSSSPDGDNTMANAAAAAATLISHSPNANSQLQAALALAMAAASPPSTCPSSSSSGQHHSEQHGSSENFRSDSRNSPLIFRPPGGGYDLMDGGSNSNDMVFPTTTMHSGNITNFSQFTGNTTSPDLSTSARLTNAMLLPASIVNAIGHQMQAGQYNQDSSQAAYLSTIGNKNNINSGGNNNHSSSQFPGDLSLGGGYGANISTTSPSNTDTGRFSSASRTSSATVHEDNINKREQRLLKNREAARECRRKKKEYVRCLERQVDILQKQNQQLIDELQKMKALCANDRPVSVIIDNNNNNSSNNATPQGSLKERHLADGMDFIDTANSHSFRRGEEHISHHPRHRLTANSSPICSTPPVPSYKMEVDSSSQRRNHLDVTRDFDTDQQMLLLQSVASAALKNRNFEQGNSGDYGNSSSWYNRKSADHQDSSSERARSPHIPPLKRALKEFGHKQEQQRRIAHQHSAGDQIAPKVD